MAERAPDRVARRSASRRTSLLTLGGAALAAALAAPAKIAAKKRKGGGNRCRKQQAQCRAAIEEYCAPQSNQQECLANYLPCCDRLTGCTAGAAVSCVFDVIGQF